MVFKSKGNEINQLLFDFFIAIWALMDILDKTPVQNIPEDHPDIELLRNFAFYFLTEQPIGKEINSFI